MTDDDDFEKITNEFIKDCQLLLDVLSFNSYALDMKIKLLPKQEKSNSNNNKDKDKSFLAEISMQAPANLWSLQLLMQRKDQPLNTFDIKLLDTLTRQSKYNKEIKLEYILSKIKDDINVSHLIRILPAKMV